MSVNTIFKTDNAILHQCDDTESFILTFFGNEITFRFCELIAFKTKIQKVDILGLLNSETPDIEILHLHHCDRFFAFSIHQILEIRELLSGAFVMLELNSIIHQKIVRNCL